MLELLHIKGYKSYEDVTFRFSEGFNILCGSSQSGKSAAQQALCLLAQGRPLGGRYLHNRLNNGNVEISAKFSDMPTITLKKSISGEQVKRTEYWIDGKDKPFSATGGNVPDEIISLLNLSDVNFQIQEDDPFMVRSSGGEFSRTVNRFIGTEELDQARYILGNRISEGAKKITVLEQQLSDTRKRLRILKGLDRVRELVAGFEETQEKLRAAEARAEAIGIMVQTLERSSALAEAFSSKKELLKKYILLLEKIVEKKTIKNNISDYVRLEMNISGLVAEKQDLEKRLEAVMAKLDVCPTCLRPMKRKGKT